MSELLVDLRGIRKTFRTPLLRRPKVALDGVDLAVPAGEVVGLLGPNGAGKTTTLKILLGLIQPTEGTGTMLGEPFGSVSARKELGFLPDAPNFYRYLTGRELLQFTGQLHGWKSNLDERVREILDLVRLEPDAWDRHLRTYSRGMLQRVGIGAAILHRPRLVVLDEPMNGLDPRGRSEFRDLLIRLKQEGVSVLLSTHVLADIEDVADRVTILDRGRVSRAGTLTELLAGDNRLVEIEFAPGARTRMAELEQSLSNLRRAPRGWIGEVDASRARDVVREIVAGDGDLLRYGPVRVSLEQFFLSQVAGTPPGAPTIRDGQAHPAAESSSALQRLQATTTRSTGDAR